MTSSKSTRRALLTSALAILMCVVMLVGTTFAWFTDTASTAVNTIQAGNLKMEVSYKNANTDGEFPSVNEETKVFDETALWEPGHVEYVVLKVKNVGTLALKYKLGINIASETGSTNVLGNEFKLSDYIKFGVIDGEADLTNRAELVADAEAADSKLIKEGYTSDETALKAESDTAEIELPTEKTVTLVVWMPESVDNNANYAKGVVVPEINLGINVLATQYTHENDSFGIYYDAGAQYADVTYSHASNQEALDEALAAPTDPEKPAYIGLAPGEYALKDTHAINAGTTLAGNGTEKTVLKPDSKSYKTTDVSYKNMTIDGTATSSFDNNGVIWLDGTSSVLDNVEVVGGGTNTYGYSVRAGANTTIANSYIHGAFRAIMAYDVQDTLLVENCILAPVCYTINIDAGTGKLVVNNSALKGWTSYTSSIESATFTDCVFEKNTASGSYGYNYLCPHTNTVLKNCDFGANFQIGAGSPNFTVTIDDCTYNGEDVTADNVKNMLDIDDVLKTCTIIVNGVTVTW